MALLRVPIFRFRNSKPSGLLVCDVLKEMSVGVDLTLAHE